MTTTMQRLDVSTIRGDDVSALAVLANALGWRVNCGVRGVSFSHESGTHFNLPDNTGLKQSVFVAKVRHLCRHATLRPADGWDLADEIADTLKLRRSQRRQFVKAVVDELGGKEKLKEKPMQATAPAPAPVKQERHIVSEGPYQVVAFTKPKENEVGYRDSEAVIQRNWSDGTVDYICTWPGCNKASGKVRSISAHRNHHMRNGTPPEPPVEEPTVEPTNEGSGPVSQVVLVRNEPDEMTAEQVLEQIAALVDRGRSSEMTMEIQHLRAENKRLKTEMDDVRQRADRLEGNLLVLRELLSEIGKDADGSA